jgi:predicted SnoaL-like aldol condensation-catalyzing enzyme
LDHDLRSHPSFYVNLIAEGELVVRQELRKNGMLIDIWRVRDGMLQEHWESWRPAEGCWRPYGF